VVSRAGLSQQRVSSQVAQDWQLAGSSGPGVATSTAHSILFWVGPWLAKEGVGGTGKGQALGSCSGALWRCLGTDHPLLPLSLQAPTARPTSMSVHPTHA
jgi:hypothetical protein